MSANAPTTIARSASQSTGWTTLIVPYYPAPDRYNTYDDNPKGVLVHVPDYQKKAIRQDLVLQSRRETRNAQDAASSADAAKVIALGSGGIGAAVVTAIATTSVPALPVAVTIALIAFAIATLCLLMSHEWRQLSHKFQQSADQYGDAVKELE